MVFFDIYCSLCMQIGKSPNTVAKELSISSGTVTGWKQGRIPQNASLQKIANYFGVSVEYLLGKDENKKPAPAEGDGLSEDARRVAEIFNQLSEAGKQAAEDYLAFLQAKESAKNP